MVVSFLPIESDIFEIRNKSFLTSTFLFLLKGKDLKTNEVDSKCSKVEGARSRAALYVIAVIN